MDIFLAEFVAQFKHTVLVMPNGLNIVTGHPFEADAYESEHSIPDGELKDMLASELKVAEALAPPKEKKKKPKKGKENKDGDKAETEAKEA